MKKLILLCFILLTVSCGEKKVVQLPEIKNSKITEVNDISHAYLFFNESMPDSVELNRKNLINALNLLAFLAITYTAAALVEPKQNVLAC